MRSKFLALTLALLISSGLQSPVYPNQEISKELILGAPIPINFFGNSLSENSTADVFGILPPCTPEMASSYKKEPCISRFQYREISTSQWLDATLELSSLESLVETKTVAANFNPIFADTKWTDNRWYLNGGSSSLWTTKSRRSESADNQQRFLIEATLGPVSSAKRFSVSLVPIEMTTIPTHELSSVRKSRLTRVPFPKDFEYQIAIKQGQSMQPLQYVTSRTKDPEIINTAGTKVTVPELIFRGKAQSHSVLSTGSLNCENDLIVKVLGDRCEGKSENQVKIFPWDRAILGFLNDNIVDSLKESSTVEEWTFQGGQDFPLIKDFVLGCGYTNVFSLVSTNAPIYHINPPRWDKDERTLAMKIANTHLNAKSEIQLGYFSISLRLSSAACMWGIDKKSATASVEVVHEDGVTQKVSTSSIKVDEIADTVAINLSGFTFSSPEIKIRMMGELASEQISTKRIKGKFVTISCRKGKVVKKVTSKSPSCPEGFRKL